jgi:two-component system LytT family response regulator
MIRALIVDDEVHAQEEMASLLLETAVIEVVGCCGNGIDALKSVNTLRPQVIFLDIEMPVISGFELLNMINQDIMPHVVFVTAYDRFSLKAFEEKTLDYLLKPVDRKRLARTVAKLQKAIYTTGKSSYETQQIKRIPCLLGNRVRLVGLEEVIFLSSTAAGVHVTTMDGTYFTEVTLKVLEERTELIRCHKQHLVNIEQVREILFLESGLGEIITHHGQKIPASRHYLKLLKKKLFI